MFTSLSWQSRAQCVHKPWRIVLTELACLQVRIDIDSEQPTQLRVKLVASLLSAEQLAGIPAWDPHAMTKPEAISNGVLEQTLLCNQADAINSMTGRSTYHGSCYMTFKGESSLHA